MRKQIRETAETSEDADNMSDKWPESRDNKTQLLKIFSIDIKLG